MLDEQVLEHFKEAFPPHIGNQLLEIDDTDIAIGNVRVLVLLFKSELHQSTSSSMLTNIQDRNEDSK